MKFTAATIISLFAAANADVLSLTPSNMEAASGKTVFIKFFAPWCGHCKAMASDWEKLAADYEGHDIALVAEVDCTTEENEELCSDQRIQGFPTLKYGDIDALEDYEGGREYDDLAAFAKDNITKKVCSIKNIDDCSDEEKADYEKYLNMSTADLKTLVESGEKKIADAEENMQKEVQKLQMKYEGLMSALEATKKEVSDSGLQKAKAAMKLKGKDEL